MIMSKKILQVCAIDLSVDVLLKPLIRAAMEEGYTVDTACSDTGRVQKLKEEGFRMIPIKIDRNLNPFSNVKSILSLFRLMKSEQYDIVHVHTPIAAVLGRIAAKLAGVPNIIYTAHGFYFHEDMSRLQYTLFYYIEKYCGRWFTDWILLQSKEDYDLCIADKFQNKDRIIHISNGVDVYSHMNPQKVTIETQLQYKKDLYLSNDDIVIGFIGRLVKEKGIIELLETMEQLRKKYKNIKLLLIGDILESERDQHTSQLIKEKLKQPYLIHTGFRKDIPELLSLVDIFVLPSYREGLPRSVIEAMAMKKPIVATNIRGCREEVHDGVNGLLVPKKNTAKLYEAINRLVENKELRETFGEESRKIALRDFNEELVIKKQLDLFEQLLTKRVN